MKLQHVFYWLTAIACSILSPLSGHAAEPSSQASAAFYEMRTYYAAPGKLDALNARFRDHTLKLFEKHGIQNIGYWVPVENSDNRLIYILGYPSREAREKAWKNFMADPDWQKAARASEVNGKLVAKVDSLYLKPTDYSPGAAPITPSGKGRLFELRTYTAAPGKLADLNKRFRDHTLKLFKKHGLTSVGYWIPADQNKGADNTLIYIVAHKDKDAAEQSWKEFRADPDWAAAKSASEANGSLTTPNGVKSVYLQATDYSPCQ